MSRLEQRLAAGQLVVTAEMPAIDGGGVADVERHLAPMKAYVDAVNATDNVAAHAHASSPAVAIAVLQAGVEPIMQLTCRDRNRLALQAEIAGAAMHGVQNVCCLTGDDPAAGDEPEAKGVFDLDGPGLVALASSMAAGRYRSGRALTPAPALFVGAVESPAEPQGARIARALEKARAGARFLQLQLSFRPDDLARFVDLARAAGLTDRVALIPSISLVRSARSLRFVDTVPGISVPPETIERVERAADEEAECFEVAVELAARALELPGVAGLHLISFRRDAGIAALCTRLGIPPRAERDLHGHRAAVAL